MNTRQQLILKLTLIIWISYILVQTALVWYIDFPIETAIKDSLISSSILSIGLILISKALNFYLPNKNKFFKILIWALMLSAMTVASSYYLIDYIIKDPEYISYLKKTIPLRFILNTILVAWVVTINILFNIQQDLQENEKRQQNALRLAKEAELFSLRQQLQPHFLFNSLNSIIALISSKPNDARNMTYLLSDFLRGTVRKDNQEFIQLKDEIEHIKLFLEIEKVRFGHRLEVEIDYKEEHLDFKLPPMIIQPLIENALKFGLYDVLGNVKVTLSVIKKDDFLKISITNPYDHQTKDSKKGAGFGLSGIHRRLVLLYGRTDLLETHYNNNIFTSTLKIPII